MKSRERVLTAIAHETPDRVPINYVGANLDIQKRLTDHFGIAMDDDDGLRAALNVDFRQITVPYVGPKLHQDVDGYQVEPLWGVRSRWIENEYGGYWDYCNFPLASATEEEVANWPMPSPNDFDYSGVAQKCKQYDDHAIVTGNPGVADLINSSGRLRSMEQVLVDLISDDPAGLLLMKRKIEIEAEVMNRTLEAAGGRIDIAWIGEDLGTQHSPMISLELYRKHLKPRHKLFCDVAQAHGAKVMMHSCGSSSWAFDDFIEIGVNIADTLQPEATNMAPAYLKETFGHRLCFNGCISTAGPMAVGAKEQAVEDLRQILETMKPGGGYIMAPTHHIQDNSPTENVLAVYEATLELGRY